MTEHKNLTAKKAIQNFQNAFGYTDEAIIRALECCANGECDECPYQDNSPCKEYLNNAALTLINRQRAEIERLTVDLDAMRGAANSYKMHYDNAKAEAVKELASALLRYVEGRKRTVEERYKLRKNGNAQDYNMGKMYAFNKVLKFLRKYEVNDENT